MDKNVNSARVHSFPTPNGVLSRICRVRYNEIRIAFLSIDMGRAAKHEPPTIILYDFHRYVSVQNWVLKNSFYVCNTVYRKWIKWFVSDSHLDTNRCNVPIRIEFSFLKILMILVCTEIHHFYNIIMYIVHAGTYIIIIMS